MSIISGTKYQVTFQATVLKGWGREILPEDTFFHPDLGKHTTCLSSGMYSYGNNRLSGCGKGQRVVVWEMCRNRLVPSLSFPTLMTEAAFFL